MTTFALPQLPITAYRRSWLMEQLRDATVYQRFQSILRALDPAAAAKIGENQPKRLFRAVLVAVSRLFPIYEYFMDWDDGEEDGDLDGDTLAHELDHGIPLVVYGWHYEHSSPAYDLGVALGHSLMLETPAQGYAIHEAGLSEWIETWWKGKSEKSRTPPKAPRGRRFVEPWNALPEFSRYVRAATGHQFLDVDFESQDGGINPLWSIGDIRAIAHDWKRAEPVWGRIQALADYVDAQPRTRLHLLDAALRHDPQALINISRPTGKRTTLAYLFTKGKGKRK